MFFTTVVVSDQGNAVLRCGQGPHQSGDQWDIASDRDYVIAGRKGKDYYRWADEWLRSEVEAVRITSADPQGAARLYETARQARNKMVRMQHEPGHAGTH